MPERRTYEPPIPAPSVAIAELATQVRRQTRLLRERCYGSRNPHFTATTIDRTLALAHTIVTLALLRFQLAQVGKVDELMLTRTLVITDAIAKVRAEIMEE